MKNIHKKYLFAVALLSAIVFGAGAQPVLLTVTPPVTSNTYPGFITLNITGLTNTEKVVVQKYLDLNANGAVDAGEPMIDAFKIADGGAMIIGGITNLNVPYDSNTATGAITTALSFAPALILENIVGRQTFVVSSPTGRFAPVTATLTVTNAPFGQSINGTVYSNGVPLPNAVVVAQSQAINNPVAATVADIHGHYSLRLPPGSYTPISAMPGCIYDFSSAPTMTLSNGLSATNDLFVTSGTATISGNIYDAGTNSNVLGGALLTVQSGSLFAIAFTDTNGNYTAPVSPSFWKIQPSKERLARRAYVLPETPFQVNTTTGNVANANIALPKGTALFHGRIVNSSNTPLANVEVDSGTSGGVNNSYDAKGYSDANGYYSVVALGDGTNQWNSEISSGKNADTANYIFNFFPTLALTSGETVLQNYVALPITASIAGNVQTSDTKTNLAGVTLEAFATIGGMNYQSLDGTTDNAGNYSLGVASGQWSVQFLTGGFSDNLDTTGYEDLASAHYVTVPPTNAVLNLLVYPLGTPFITSPQRFSSTQFGFTVNGASNVTYTVQAATSLVASNWMTLFSLTLTTNTGSPVVDVNATNSARYYRVLKN